MLDLKAVLKWLVAVVSAVASVALVALAEAFTAFDPSTVTDNPFIAAIVVAVIAAVVKAVGWLVSRLPR
jgi:uncharacterized membrane protein YvlD (DUF360 family)